jgi:chromosome segregation ATPase
MKCTQCGCENLTPINIESLISISGDASMRNSESLKIYTCSNCGHLEFFDNGLNEKMAEESEIEKKYEKEISVLIEKQNQIENGELKQLKEELACIESQLKSLDITIRQQQELKKNVKTLNAKIENVLCEIRKIKTEIERLKSNQAHELAKVRFKYSRYGR